MRGRTRPHPAGCKAGGGGWPGGGDPNTASPCCPTLRHRAEQQQQPLASVPGRVMAPRAPSGVPASGEGPAQARAQALQFALNRPEALLVALTRAPAADPRLYRLYCLRPAGWGCGRVVLFELSRRVGDSQARRFRR
ncbi:hypothetical protein PLESTB_000372600 [Pleodorina starrii]|uniref:Uncharacterized protein n=1 Tax=Pleodorina starrii TaxID=330485 RepID=A0A9W6BEQ2_9CHLO|nr:hypothetical protein PLESTM_000022300 [Pleodorina starrii]GLC50378.1 hypothetical protein PLESTB_000372600 [Pleodorina starrii]GLC64241.1 hypothetical protein PLESTF_000140100 [Pleodorina starrii]